MLLNFNLPNQPESQFLFQNKEPTAGFYYKDFRQKAKISPKSPCEVMLQTDVQISDDKIVHSLCPSLYTICQQQPSCGSLIELDLLLDNNSKRVFSEIFLSDSLVSWTSRATIIDQQKSTYIIYNRYGELRRKSQLRQKCGICYQSPSYQVETVSLFVLLYYRLRTYFQVGSNFKISNEIIVVCKLFSVL